ncbi:MAG: DUF4430 domain-containing protein [Candidatus Micrarchaeota archaeon]
MDWRILAVGLALVLAGCVQQQALATPSAAEPVALNITLAVNDGSGIQIRHVGVEKGWTLFEAMQRYTEIEYKQYGEMGNLITAIDGVRQDSGGNQKYWQYYVDGRLGSEGVSAYKIEKPQTIEWRYEEIDPGLT